MPVGEIIIYTIGLLVVLAVIDKLRR